MEPLKFNIDDYSIPPPVSAFLWPIEIVMPSFDAVQARIAARMSPFQIVIPDYILITEPLELDLCEDQRKPLASDCIINSSLYD
jgi:hypothetical protein